MKAFVAWLDSCGKLGKTLIVLALILAAGAVIRCLLFFASSILLLTYC